MNPKLIAGLAAGAVGTVAVGSWALTSSSVELSSEEPATEAVAGARPRLVESCKQTLNGTLCGKEGSGQLCVANSCVKNVCGDSVVYGAEECDDGNHGADDGCSPDCKWEEVATCGNGTVEGQEECDDANANDGDRCTGRCTYARCGDGAQGFSEECDDGNVDDTDGCTAKCRRITADEAYAELKAGRGKPGSYAAVVGAANSAASASAAAARRAAGGGSSSEGSGGGGLGGSSSSRSGVTANTAEGDPEEACTKCREKNCRTFLGADIFAGCFEAVNSSYGAPQGDSDFLQNCADAVICAREHECAYRPERQGAACYCGSHSVDDCVERGPAKDAPCVKEWQVATRTTDNQQVLLRMSDSAFPSGWAYHMLECDRQFCKECQTL